MRLPVFYKDRDLLFHPVWDFTIPNFLLRVPLSIVESIVWTVVTYFSIGYAPEASSVISFSRIRTELSSWLRGMTHVAWSKTGSGSE
ncbi:hypothetical protein Q3G72_022274 [Acer saccharum]|nr:hypothetical protein Q3G72_022274 [Acer saccharum]